MVISAYSGFVKYFSYILLTGCPWLLSCTVVKTEHHITLDHNITIKVEKEVNDFLDDLYEGTSAD